MFDGHLNCFHFLTVVNSAIIYMKVHMYFQQTDLISFGYIPNKGIVGSYGSSIFNFLSNLYTVSTMAILICIVPTVGKGSLFFTSSLVFAIS
jgi:hypothetical protein